MKFDSMANWIGGRVAKVVTLALVLGLSVSSCMDTGDDYSVQPEWLTMAALVSGGSNPVFQREDGITLTTVNSMSDDTLVVGRRYLLRCVLGDTINHPPKSYPVYVKAYRIPDTKQYVVWEKDSADQWGNAPIDKLTLWFSGHYLNAYFISYATVGTYNTFELLRVKQSETALSTDTVPTLNFEFRHNTESYSTAMSFERAYSFDLDSLQRDFPAATKFKLKITFSYLKYYTQLPARETLVGIYYPNRQSNTLFGSLKANEAVLPLPH